MLILVDSRAPDEAKQKLGEFGEVHGLSTDGLVYESISGHPDIFIAQFASQIITAANLPAKYKSLFKRHHIKCTDGKLPVGKTYPETARYNVVVTEKHFIHNLEITDNELLRAAKGKKKIHVSQGYTRCNLIALNDEQMITSDRGIYTRLKQVGIDVLHVSPEGIRLPGFKNGFIGGTCGIVDQTVCFIGKLSCHAEGKKLERFIRDAGFEIIELYDGPLFDGGGIFFL